MNVNTSISTIEDSASVCSLDLKHKEAYVDQSKKARALLNAKLRASRSESLNSSLRGSRP
jgi:hypothetical protein